MTKENLVQLVFKVLDSPKITDLDLCLGQDEIRFDWYGKRYKVSETILVEQVRDGMLESNATTTLMSKLLKLS